ncbi:hypothetical protein Tco_0810690 [Tanacetum coccineum]
MGRSFTTTSSQTTVRRSGASGTTGASDSAPTLLLYHLQFSLHSSGRSGQQALQHPSSSKTAASDGITLLGQRLIPDLSVKHTDPDDLYMDEDTTADVQVLSSDDEVGRDHVPTVNLRQSWWKPLTEDRPRTRYLLKPGTYGEFMDWFVNNEGISEYYSLRTWEGPAFEIVKVFHRRDSSPIQMEECLSNFLLITVDDANHQVQRQQASSLEGEPGHMKAACYPDVGLEQLVPDQFWIEEECKYDIAAMYGISHWWVQRQRFYIDRFSSEGDRRAVRTHMRILSDQAKMETDDTLVQ